MSQSRAAPLVDNKAPDASLDELTNQMRSLVQAKQPTRPSDVPIKAVELGDKIEDQHQQLQPTVPPKKERDACTRAALRAAGVGGYQDSEESEAALSIALANAEFIAKQRMAVTPTTATTGEASRRSKDATSVFDFASAEMEDIDIEEVEDASGYGKK